MEVVTDGTTFFRGQFLGCASGRYRNWSDCDWQSRLICCDHYTCFRSVSDARSPVPYYCPEVIKINQSSITTLGLSGHQSGSWHRCVWSFIITNVSKYYSKWSSSIFYLIFSIFRNPLQPQLFFTTNCLEKYFLNYSLLLQCAGETYSTICKPLMIHFQICIPTRKPKRWEYSSLDLR